LREAPGIPRILLKGEAPGAMSLDELRERGRRALTEDPEYMLRLKAEVTPADHAILYLTSGATGDPKMALVTHGAIVANLDMGQSIFPIGPKDATVAFLPSAHIAQRVVVELLTMRLGTPLYFAESLLKLPQHIRSVRPTMLLAPPRMWERIYSTVCTELRKRPAVARRAFYGALAMAQAAATYKHQGERVPARIRVPHKAGRPAVLPEDPGTLRGASGPGVLRRRAFKQGTGAVLRSDRHAADRGLRPDRRRSGDDEPDRPAQGRQYRQAAARR